MEWIKKRWIAVALMIVLGSLSIWQLRNLKIGGYFKSQVSRQSHYIQTERDISNSFAIKDLVLIAIPSDDKNKVSEAATVIRGVKGVSLVINPLEFPFTVGGKVAFAQQLGLVGKYKGKDYAILIAIISSQPEKTSTEISRLTKKYGAALFGNSFIAAKALEYIGFILKYLSPIAICVIFVIFYISLKNFWAALLSFLPSLLATVYMLGIYGAIGKTITLENVLMPFITLVMGSAAGLHYMSHYLSIKDPNCFERAYRALKETFIPLLMTTSTTVVGFLSLCFTSSPVMTELGLSGAYGVGMAGFATFVFLPSIASFLRYQRTQLWKDGITNYLIKHRKINLIILVGLSILLCFFVLYVKQEFHVLMFFRKSSKVMEGSRIVESISQVSIPVMVKINLSVEPLSKQGIEIIEQVRQSALKYARRTLSILDINEMIPPLFRNVVSFVLPEGTFVNRVDKSALMLVFLKDLSKKTHYDLQNTLESLSLEGLKEVSVTGENYKYLQMNDETLSNQRVSIILAIFLITLMMILMLKDFKLGLMSMIPIILSILNIYGFLGLFNIPLNVISAYIMNIALGAGIDYAIHFTYTYKMMQKRKVDLPLVHTLNIAARPILANAFGVGIGFCVLLLSPMRVHVHIALLMFIAMFMSAFYTLFWMCGIIKYDKTQRISK
ncbi:efflux RND transporter permease subunit [Thermotoga profunda]|uniref:efflux RND transporter permease subunit n=1 Tax=Thermotoga profunda TaxID=1508420 RepID=UPI000596EF35|nr:MMPL family transporter [Thermotoga profunda]